MCVYYIHSRSYEMPSIFQMDLDSGYTQIHEWPLKRSGTGKPRNLKAFRNIPSGFKAIYDKFKGCYLHENLIEQLRVR
jgi:hypothetical protein